MYRAILGQLGVEPALALDPDEPGVFVSSARSEETGGRVVHLLNLDGYDKVVTVKERGAALFGGNPVTLRQRDGVMLPIGVTAGGCEIAWATVEIADVEDDLVRLRLTGDADVIGVRHGVEIVEGEGSVEDTADGLTLVRARRTSPSEECLALRRR
jgi:beta-galactosidase